MAGKKFTIVAVDYRDYDTDHIGISKDAFITNAPYGIYAPSGGNITLDPSYNFGDGPLSVGDYYGGTGSNHYMFIIVEVQIPNKEDVTTGGEVDIVEATLKFIANGSTYWNSATYLVVGIAEIDDDFTEGELYEAAGFCCWAYAKDGIPWVKGDGSVASRGSLASEDGTPLDSYRLGSGSVYMPLSITDGVDWGEKKRFAIFILDSDVGSGDIAWTFFHSRENATPANRPVLYFRYRDYAPEAFADKDSALSIEPNPNNPEQPLLKWGGVKDADFVDFKLYRETSPITTVALLTPIATITSPADQEYIDTDALTDNQTYYYLVIAEDGNNTLDDATFSNQIAWTKPDVTTAVISATGAQDVGTSETLTVVSPQNIKRLYVDWGDDIYDSASDVQSWYEYETVGVSKTATHIYSKDTATIDVGIYVRVEDDDGFWSSLTALTGSSANFWDVNPLAKLRVSVKKAQLGDYVTLDASLSQPKASNITITKYEFKRDASDSYQDNGTNPVYTFQTGAGHYPTTIGVKTATLKITTSVPLYDTDTATYELETGTPTELVFSKDTKIHELNHDLPQNKLVEIPIGSAGTSHEFLISRPPERVTLVGTSNHPNTGADITLIRSAWLNNTFVRFIIKSEMELKTVTYDGKIDGDISLGQAYHNKQSWTFPLRVITRTET